MAGIKVPGFFVPGTTTGYVVASSYVRGGYIVVTTEDEKSQLNTEVCIPGTLVYVVESNKEYRFTSTSQWEEINTDVEEIQQELETLQTNLTALQSEVGSLQTNLTDLQSSVGTLQTQVNALPTEEEVDTKIAEAVAGIQNLTFKIVTQLPSPEEAQTNIIYVVPASESTTGNLYNEYIWTGTDFELIGGGSINLEDYYTKSETDNLLNEKQPTLVSGVNIKTINNESLLGEGNITITGGGTIQPATEETVGGILSSTDSGIGYQAYVSVEESGTSFVRVPSIQSTSTSEDVVETLNNNSDGYVILNGNAIHTGI